MRQKPITPRELARCDVEDAIDHYHREGGPTLALDFIEALERAYAHVSRHPSSGSPRFGHELGLPGLRHWQLARFPYVIFYVERAESIDVWRVLRAERDIADWMRE